MDAGQRIAELKCPYRLRLSRQGIPTFTNEFGYNNREKYVILVS